MNIIKLADQEKEYCINTTDKLINFWKFHRRVDANIKGLSVFTKVSRDTAYRWLNRKTLPRLHKAKLIEKWLMQRKTS